MKITYLQVIVACLKRVPRDATSIKIIPIVFLEEDLSIRCIIFGNILLKVMFKVEMNRHSRPMCR